MKFKQPLAISIYRKIKCWALIESVQEGKDEEIEDDELQFLVNEISYFRSLFEEEGTSVYEDLKVAKAILRKTVNGKVTIIDPSTMKEKEGFTKLDVLRAKDIISEYRQLKYYQKKLNKLGYF